MADATKELSIVITAKDEASRVIQGIGSAFGNLVEASKTGSFIFAGSLAVVGKSIIDAASDLEQAKIAFTTFEGSATAASKTLKELSDFAKVTPFTFPTITEAAKRLMAYGVAANDLIPTLKNLGDISAGVGTDKLPQLILAFGQVKAKTTLAGTELRQFTETGIPIIEALVNVLNKSGGAMVQTATKTKGTAEEIGNLNDRLAIAKQRLSEVTSNAKAHTSTIMSAKDAVQNYEQKLAKATATTGGLSVRTKVTAADIADMASKGEISFDMVQKALESMTVKGGKFFNLMDKQSQSFSGVMSNISDQLTRVALNLAGISTKAEDFGTVIKGGAFDLVKQGAEAALAALNALEPKVKGLIDAFLANKMAIGIFLGVLVGGLLGAAVAVTAIFAPLLALMALFGALGAVIAFVVMNWNNYWPLFVGGFTTLATIILSVVVPAFVAWAAAAIPAAIAVVVALGPIILAAVAIGAAVTLLAIAWKNNFLGIQQITQSVIDFIIHNPLQFLLDMLIITLTGGIGILYVAWEHNWFGMRDIVQKVIDWFGNTAVPFIKDNFVGAILKLLDALSGGWISRFGMMKDAVEGVIGAIASLISKASDLASKAAKGLKIPGFQHGGFVPGSYGEAVPAILHGGERVIPRTGTDVNPGGGGGGGVTINISGSFNLDSDVRVQELADKIINILGRQNELYSKGLSI